MLSIIFDPFLPDSFRTVGPVLDCFSYYYSHPTKEVTSDETMMSLMNQLKGQMHLLDPEPVVD